MVGEVSMRHHARAGAIVAATMWLAVALTSQGAERNRDLVDGAPARLAEYIRIDTTNPPGNEARAVDFFAAILDAEGIPHDSAESAPGRGNLWSRIEGGEEPALVLLNHTDVVPADASRWTQPPLSGAIANGYVWGRGALDMKSTGIVQLQAFIALHRSGRRPDRDVLFVATADEEAGGELGAGWLVRNKPELFAGVGFLLNEGGRGMRYEGDTPVIGIETTQKVPLWLRLTFDGPPSHGAVPRVETAVTRLVRALDRLTNYDFAPRVLPMVQENAAGIADLQRSDLAPKFKDLAANIHDREFLLALQLANPGLHAAMRNTCSLTRLGASDKINVVPTRAWAELDCRLLPDQDAQQFISDLRALMNEPTLGIETILSFSPAVSSTDTPLYAAMRDLMTREFKGARVLPVLGVAFTDSHFFRDRGVQAYGFSPFVFADGEYAPGEGAHGNDERISVDNLTRGTRVMITLLEKFTR
jgi:acetylornithine deacetylase/succinyl-diaminopimelate desuccinylase-like protein